jgi:hypothetical protein
VTDGPYLEAREQFAGCYLVDCGSRERAIELAALLLDAKYSVTEVRAVMHEAARRCEAARASAGGGGPTQPGGGPDGTAVPATRQPGW